MSLNANENKTMQWMPKKKKPDKLHKHFKVFFTKTSSSNKQQVSEFFLMT